MHRISLHQAVKEIRLAVYPDGRPLPPPVRPAPARAMAAAGAGADAPDAPAQAGTWSQPHGADSRRADPFFLFVGAGVSYPAIPLASGIERMCREAAEKNGYPLDPDLGEGLRKSAFQRYSDAFDAAFPHATDRQKFLKKLIQNRPIPPATLRLAHLLASRRLTSTIVTCNFDDLLTRALALFGEQHVRICDHPATSDRFNTESEDLRIVHVHGTYWSYDLCNLRNEVKGRATDGTGRSMRTLLEGMLTSRSPLVVGYSGWEEDVFMTALRRRLEQDRRLPYRLYWFCYGTQSEQDLPRWLTDLDHPDVYLVFHPESRALRSTEPLGRRAGDEEMETMLPADMVFEHLMRQFGVVEPDLTRDPFAFFADYLGRSLFGEGPSSRTRDAYLMRGVIDRLRRAGAHTAHEPVLEQLRGCVRAADYPGVIAAARDLVHDPVRRAQVMGGALTGELVELLLLSADALPNGCEEQSLACELVIGLAEESGDTESLLRASIGRARNLVLSGQRGEAERLLQALESRFGKVETPGVRQAVMRAASLRRIAGLVLDASEAAREVIRELSSRVCGAPAPGTRVQTEKLIVDAGERLLKASGYTLALRIFNAVLEPHARPGAASSTPLYPSLRAAAQYGRIRALRGLRQRANVLAAIREFIREHGKSELPGIMRMVAYAWHWRDQLGGDDDDVSPVPRPGPDVPTGGHSPRKPRRPRGGGGGAARQSFPFPVVRDQSEPAQDAGAPEHAEAADVGTDVGAEDGA